MKSPLDEAILAAHPFDMSGWKKIDEVPFDFERRRVSVLVEHDAKRRLIVKGAPEDLLRLSGRYEDADGEERPLDAETRRTFEATLDALGAQGFRALGIARRVVDGSHETAAITDETDLVFSGFAVFLDPPKASAGATIQAMAAAGICREGADRRQRTRDPPCLRRDRRAGHGRAHRRRADASLG